MAGTLELGFFGDERFDSLRIGAWEEICRTSGALNFFDLDPSAYALG